MVKKKLYLSIVTLLIVITSCGDIVDPPELKGFGVPFYSIKMDAEEYSKFSAHVFTNYAANATLETAGQNYEIKIEHQGFTSRELFKLSYEINFRDLY